MKAQSALFYAKLVGLPLGIGVLLYWASQEESLRERLAWRWELAAGTVLSLVAMAPLAQRFRLAMRIGGISLTLAQSLRINALSAFYHFFVPLSVGSELTKFVQLRLAAPERGAMRAAGAIVLDHVIGFSALLVILAVLWVGDAPLRIDIDAGHVGLAVLAINVIGGLIAWRLRERLRPLARELQRRVIAHRLDALLGVSSSATMQMLLACAVLLPARAWGIDISYAELLFVLAASSLLAAVPVNVAGIGAAEVAGTGLFMALGLGSPQAVLLISLLFCYRLLFAVLGGGWDFVATRRTSGVAAAPESELPNELMNNRQDQPGERDR